MEEEKPQSHQLDPADQGAADAPIYYHVTVFDADDDQEEEDDDAAATKFWASMEEGPDLGPKKKVWTDWQNRAAAIAADEEMAHRLYMQEIMEMEEWELRGMDDDRPSSSSSSSSRAGVGGAKTTAAPGKFWAGTPPYALQNPRERGTFDFESVHDAESGAEFLGNSRIPGPLEALADERIRETRATRSAGTNTASRFMRPGPRDFATTTPARRTALSKDAAAGSSSSSTQRDPVSIMRRALLADADSAMVFSGMEEWHDNSWYEVSDDDDDENPEQVGVHGLTESLQSCRLRSEPRCSPGAAEGHEFSLQDFCQKWGVTPSDVNPDEPGPSKKVPPLADDEVATFDCGICRDTLLVLDLFHRLPCKHRFCAPCMTAYVEGRIRAGELPIPCPNTKCKEGGVLHPETCKKAVDYAAFGDWGDRLAESAVPPGKRAYCPNRRCELRLVETTGVAEQVMAPCPACGHALVRKLAQD